MRRTGLLFVVTALTLGACVYDLDFHTQGSGAGASGSGSTGSAGLCAPGATASCYDGPAGTEGMGICKAGVTTCAADGESWSACAGEVLPQPPDCASGMDLHCDGVVPTCDGSLLWAKRFGIGAPFLVVDESMAVDGAGDVVLAGEFTGAVNFGGDTLTSQGSDGYAFVVKLDGSGQHVWSKSFGDPGSYTFARSVAVDSAGNVFLTGFLNGSVDFGGGPLNTQGEGDVFVVALDPNGQHLWSKSFGDANDQEGTGVTSDGAGSVLLTGFFLGSVDFGGGPLTSAGGREVFVTKLGAGDGHYQWNIQSGGDVGAQQGQLNTVSIATDTAHAAVVGGTFRTPLNFGGGPLQNSGGWDVFLAKLDTNGQHVWSKSFASAGPQLVPANVAVDATDSALVTGTFATSINFGGAGDALASATGGSVFMAKLGPNGQYAWSESFENAGGQGVASDAVGNVLLTGGFAGSIDFGDGALASAGVQDAFLVKRKPAGGHLWSRRFGAANGSAQGTRVMADAAGNAFVTGFCNGGPIDFGGGPVSGSNGQDIFVAKLTP